MSIMDRVDMPKLRAGIARDVRDLIMGLVDAADRDVRAYADDIARDMILAAATNNVELQKTFERQFRVLAELHRLKINDTAWTAFSKGLRLIFSTLFTVLAAL